MSSGNRSAPVKIMAVLLAMLMIGSVITWLFYAIVNGF